MKRFIAPADIRAGDLIRFESTLNEYASEWRADGHPRGGGSGTYYLLDRPEPAVELPTEPTLGWIETKAARTLARWQDATEGDVHEYDASGDRVNTWYGVTAFTPATAVPTEALDELRRRANVYSEGSPTSDFLAAVDEANRA